MSFEPQPERIRASSQKPAGGNLIALPLQAATSAPRLEEDAATDVMRQNKKPIREEKRQNQDVQLASAFALLYGGMQATRENGKIFRQKQAEKLGLSPKEIQRREVIEESVTRIRIPESIEAKMLHETLETIHKTNKALTRWKKTHPDDPLIEELQAMLSSREATIKLLLDM